MPREIPRREALKHFIAAGAMTIFGEMGHIGDSIEALAQQDGLASIVKSIKEKEAELGGSALSYEQVRELAPLFIDFYFKASGSGFVANDSVKDFSINRSIIEKINSIVPSNMQEPPDDLYCQRIAPIITLRSLVTNSLSRFDLEYNAQTKLIEDESFVAALKRDLFPKDASRIQSRNFTVSYLSETPEGDMAEVTCKEFGDFVVDYSSFRITKACGLAYTAAYATANDFENFESVIHQAGLTQESLIRMYKNGELQEFLSKVAQSTKNISFASKEEMLAFGLAMFPLNKEFSLTPQM